MDRQETIQRILSAWQCCPQLRLGQFLDNAMTWTDSDLFNIEDSKLVDLTEKYARNFEGVN